MEEKALASSLSKYISEMGGATNIDSRFIFKEHIDAPPFSRPYRTNANGEILDFWNTPFHIEIIKVTNLTIRSAGPDQKFGDADDIIFNSLTNGFVKP